MLTGIIGFEIGTFFGLVITCCLVVAGEADKAMEKRRDDDNE